LVNDAKQNGFFEQLWDMTGLYQALCRTNLGALAGIVATNAITAQFPTDGAWRAPKGSSNLSHGELLKMKTGQGHTLFWLDMLIVLGWGNLHLRTLKGRP
jgi:hypothetical protein